MISVLVVDDSAFMRHTIANRLLNAPDIKVVGSARDGIDALEKIKELKPDVVTLDVEMPRMDGLTALKIIMQESPCPVVMLSALTREGAVATLRALELGAIDFVPKPSRALSLDMDAIRDELLAKVRGARGASVSRLKSGLHLSKPPLRKEVTRPTNQPADRVVMIGSSTGGPRALFEVFSRISGDLPVGVVVVQHMPAGFTKSLAERLDQISAMHVKEAEPADRLLRGNALVAPGDYHMSIVHHGEIRLEKGPRMHGVRPAIDITMESVAKHFPRRCVGVVLTGMGHDGTTGAVAIKGAGGFVIAQDEATSVIYGMPRSVYDSGSADRVVPLERIADEIGDLVSSLPS